MPDFLSEQDIRRIIRGMSGLDDDKTISGFGMRLSLGELRALCATALVAAPNLDAARDAVSILRDRD